jgi:hypothetical protein
MFATSISNMPTKSYFLSHARAAPPNDATQILLPPSDCPRCRQGAPEPHPPDAV